MGEWIALSNHDQWIFMSRIGRYGDMDLTPLEFFLWGYVKDKVYADTPQSFQEFKEKIRAVIDEIEPQICKNVMENFIKKAWSCKRSRGGHMNDIVSHY